jgi:hypothetical protein
LKEVSRRPVAASVDPAEIGFDASGEASKDVVDERSSMRLLIEAAAMTSRFRRVRLLKLRDRGGR